MVGWNYIVTPGWMGVSRDVVVAMLWPIIIPFNLIKHSINSAIVVLIQKPVLRVFKSSNLIDREIQNQKTSIYLLAIIVLISAISLVILLNNM